MARATPLPIVLLVCASLVSGCDGMPGKPRPADRPVRPTQVMEFDRLYDLHCQGCHGADGTKGAARNLDDALFQALIPDDELTSIVADGVPDTAMPGFALPDGPLTPDQVHALVEGMRERWTDPQRFVGLELPAYRAASSGDADRGGSAYGTYCAHCHGTDGTGGEHGGSVLDDSYLALVSDQALRTALICGRTDLGMPDWRTQSDDQAMSSAEIDDIVAWLVSHRQEYPGRPYADDGHR